MKESPNRVGMSEMPPLGVDCPSNECRDRLEAHGWLVSKEAIKAQRERLGGEKQ